MVNHKVIFFSTPDFGVPTLKALHESEFDVVLVVTQPDRKKGRGRKTVPPPVKTTALSYGYEVYQPETLKTPEAWEYLKKFSPDFFVVVAYGHVLPKSVLNIPKEAAVNIHGSVLPKYRGPAPIHRAIIDGEVETGVTTMLMAKGLDEGDMLLTEKTTIGQKDTTETLYDRLAETGAALLVKTLQKWIAKDIVPIPQNHKKASYAPLLAKAEGLMDWEKSAVELDRFIRGMTPWPGAHTYLSGRRIKVFSAEIDLSETPPYDKGDYLPGEVKDGYPGEIRVMTGEGDLLLNEIQPEGKKRMSASDFLKGCPIPPCTRFKNNKDTDD